MVSTEPQPVSRVETALAHFSKQVATLRQEIGVERGTPKYMAGMDLLRLRRLDFFNKREAQAIEVRRAAGQTIPYEMQRVYDSTVAQAAQTRTLMHERATGPQGEDYTRAHDEHLQRIIRIENDGNKLQELGGGEALSSFYEVTTKDILPVI